uniref:Uncharacterized protein n=1 Tax=Acidithiobacillus sulfuriphilus TaxID=1867749 RepID=A0A3M8RNP6_9PROT|nr:hypothetical protein EC580_02105 [Acidithiobacillus sulfuriphilus]
MARILVFFLGGIFLSFRELEVNADLFPRRVLYRLTPGIRTGKDRTERKIGRQKIATLLFSDKKVSS